MHMAVPILKFHISEIVLSTWETRRGVTNTGKMVRGKFHTMFSSLCCLNVFENLKLKVIASLDIKSQWATGAVQLIEATIKNRGK